MVPEYSTSHEYNPAITTARPPSPLPALHRVFCFVEIFYLVENQSLYYLDPENPENFSLIKGSVEIFLHPYACNLKYLHMPNS